MVATLCQLPLITGPWTDVDSKVVQRTSTAATENEYDVEWLVTN